MHGEETLGWGVIGASRMAGQFMVEAIRSQPPLTQPASLHPSINCWVAGVFSHNEDRGLRFAAAHQLPHAFVNLADLLKRADIHCVYIGSHPRHHAQAALAALAAGKHVLCEPPLALTLQEAEAIAHTALSRDLRLGINYHHRADAATARLRELLAEDEIGDLLGGRLAHTEFLLPPRQTWRLRPNGGGVVLDHLVRDIDLLRYLLHDEVSQIDAVSTQQLLGQAVEEDVVSHVTLRQSGLVFQLHDSFIVPHRPSCLEIYGAAGVLTLHNVFSEAAATELTFRRSGQVTHIAAAAASSHAQAVAHFCRAVRNGMPLLATPTDGMLSLGAGLAALESIRRGHRIRLDAGIRRPEDRAIG